MMSGKDREEFLAWVVSNQDDSGAANGFREKLLLSTVCDQHGKLILTEEDAVELMAQPYKITEVISEAASALNGFGDQEELEGNFDTAPSASSGSS